MLNKGTIDLDLIRRKNFFDSDSDDESDSDTESYANFQEPENKKEK